jgi:hypothetical protein
MRLQARPAGLWRDKRAATAIFSESRVSSWLLDGGIGNRRLTLISPHRGSKLTSPRFHHKLHLRRTYGATSPDGFISGREINTASAFQFYSNLVLIEVGLQIATVPELSALVFALTPFEQ